MNIRVETYSGARLHERPRRFWRGETRLEVKEVLASWQTPDYISFKVTADDGHTYLLHYHQVDDRWELSRV